MVKWIMKRLDFIIEFLGRILRRIGQHGKPQAFPKPNYFELIFLNRESLHRKKATSLKKEKHYLEAVEELKKAREAQYRTAFYYDCSTLLRIPKYLILAQRYSEAIKEALLILKREWPISGDKDEFRNTNQHEILSVISDAFAKSGNIRMANYYYSLAEKEIASVTDSRISAIKHEFEKSFKLCGSDLGRISSDCGTKNSRCRKWHGKIISVLGKTKGYPTLKDIDKEALFNADTYHRIDYIDPDVDPIT